MAELKNKIENDFKKLLKENNKIGVEVLRMAKSVIKNTEIEKQKGLSDEEVIEALSKEVKKREESAGLYRKGGREELASKEEKEIIFLDNYLPSKLSDEEIKNIVKKILAETNAQSVTDHGKVMGKVMAEIKNRADGKKVSSIVQEELNKL